MTLTVGIDFDSYGLHVCALPVDGGPPVVVTSPLRKRGGRDDEHRAIQACGMSLSAALAQIYEVTPGDRAAALTVQAGLKRPRIESAWIERGFGSSRKADFILGAIYGATIAAAAQLIGYVPMRPMLASSWKREVTGEVGITTKAGGRGNGNAKKDLANACCLEIWRDRWPLAIAPGDPNQLDAFGVAWAGALQ